VNKVAAHLGVAKDSIYRWVETKSLPACRVGRLLRFKLSEVDAWVQAGGGGRAARTDPGGTSGNRFRKGGRSR
jgi:excisionase family DNA binding protein